MTYPWKRLWKAFSTTLFVYTFQLAFAFSIAYPMSSIINAPESVAIFPYHTITPEKIIFAIEDLRQAELLIKLRFPYFIGILIIYLMMNPILTMQWFCAIRNPNSIGKNLSEAISYFHSSILISLLCCFILVVSTCLNICIMWMIYSIIRLSKYPNIQDIICISAIFFELSIIILVATLHDISRAFLCFYRANIFRALWKGLMASASFSKLIGHMFWFSCAFLITILCVQFSATADNHPSCFLYISIFVVQFLLLIRTYIRGRWLAGIVTDIEHVV